MQPEPTSSSYIWYLSAPKRYIHSFFDGRMVETDQKTAQRVLKNTLKYSPISYMAIFKEYENDLWQYCNSEKPSNKTKEIAKGFLMITQLLITLNAYNTGFFSMTICTEIFSSKLALSSLIIKSTTSLLFIYLSLLDSSSGLNANKSLGISAFAIIWLTFNIILQATEVYNLIHGLFFAIFACAIAMSFMPLPVILPPEPKKDN